jgi:hypothetical protein
MAETSGLRTSEVRFALIGLVLIVVVFGLAYVGTVYRTEHDRQQQISIERLRDERNMRAKQLAEARVKREKQLALARQKAARKPDVGISNESPAKK